jgi:hypothetical protein
MPTNIFDMTEMYEYETESKLYQISSATEQGEVFRDLQSGNEKIEYLKAYGQQTDKPPGERGMIRHVGSWLRRVVGQTEFMIDTGTLLGIEYERLGGDLEEKRQFFEHHSTRIRQWPASIIPHPTAV